MRRRTRNVLLGAGGAALGLVLLLACNHGIGSGGTGGPQRVRDQEAKHAEGQAIADAHMAQWKKRNPDRVSDWVAEEKERHTIQPPADNSALLKGEQGKSHVYGQYTERDILLWARETEKLAVEGSRIFHDAGALGSTVAVSCDMCHPDAANTHPETYPKFQAQLGRVALLRDMINWCVEHPVRGKRFEPDDHRMRALEAYIYAQRKGTPLDYGRH